MLTLSQKVDAQQQQIEMLRFLIASLLTKFELVWLLRLYKHAFFKVTYDFREEFTAEMRHLLALGFVGARTRYVFDEMYGHLKWLQEKSEAEKKLIEEFSGQKPSQALEMLQSATKTDDPNANVHDYFVITESGNAYIELRKQAGLTVELKELEEELSRESAW